MRRNGAGYNHPVLNQRAQVAAYESLVNNIITLRRELGRLLADPRRDLYDECGWPKSYNLTAQHYQDLFDRDPIAARVVEVMPRQCWGSHPLIYESKDVEEVTEFEQRFDDVGKRLRGAFSWFDGADCNPLVSYWRMADEASGIGQYGIILLGLDDVDEGGIGVPLSSPVVGVEEIGSATIEYTRAPDGSVSRKVNPATQAYSLNAAPGAKRELNLNYIRVFPEVLAPVVAWENNPSSPRYGQPVMYSISMVDPNASYGSIGVPTSTQLVHWTRVIHIADNYHQVSSNPWLAVPRMRPVINELYDGQKVSGSSSEGYYKACFSLMSFETLPAALGEVDIDYPKLKDLAENLQNGLQRIFTLEGLTAKTHAPSVVDPTPHIKSKIERICIKIEVPIRIFMGSERGELSSAQDSGEWGERVSYRRTGYCIPHVIVPTVDRLIWLGALPEPDSYYVEWEGNVVKTETEKAEVFGKRMAGFAAYVSGNVSSVISPSDMLTREAGYSEEDAETILENAEELAADKEAEAEAIADEEGFAKAPPEGFTHPPEVETPKEETLAK